MRRSPSPRLILAILLLSGVFVTVLDRGLPLVREFVQTLGAAERVA